MRTPMAIRLADDEREVVEAAADAFGLPTATWARRVLVGTARQRLDETQNEEGQWPEASATATSA